jgi:hypothetical protein
MTPSLRLLVLCLTAASSVAAAQRLLEPPTTEPRKAPTTVSPTDATPAPPHQRAAPATPQHSELGLELAAAARGYVRRAPQGFRADCSGFVEAVLSKAGLPVYGTVAQMYDAAEQLGAIHHLQVPRVGDLVFFHNTYDRNHNGKQDDLYSHIAVVIDLEPDGTIVMAHHGSSRTTIRMNLDPERIHDKLDRDGKTINNVLKYRYDAPLNWPLRLTSQNWAAFATVREGDDWSALLPRG